MTKYRCVFAKDVKGLYVLPLIGYSKMPEYSALWVGWWYWLWELRWNEKRK